MHGDDLRRFLGSGEGGFCRFDVGLEGGHPFCGLLLRNSSGNDGIDQPLNAALDSAPKSAKDSMA